MRPHHALLLSLAAGIPLVVFAGCSPDAQLPTQTSTSSNAVDPVSIAEGEPIGSSVLDQMNQRLADMGLNVRVSRAEFVTAGGSGAVGQSMITDDARLHAIGMFVPNDTRRNAAGTSIRYLVDQSDVPNGVGMADAESAIDRAMATWNGLGKAPIAKVADPGVDPDLADGLFGFGSVGTPHFADIVHAGFMPPAFFNHLFPGGGSQILGVTFRFSFVPPTDIDGDKMIDVAYSEIYYNNHFTWGVNADPPVADVETVALHEAGHGLCLEHFGKIFVNTDADGQPRLDENGLMDLHFAPYAVMNAIIFGRHQTLEGTDTSQLSNQWSTWPTLQ